MWTKMSVILMMVWGWGAMMLIFLAGPNNIPKELHDAAEVDGASGWQRFWKISFPLLTPYIFYNLVVGMIAALQIFEPIFVLYRDNQPIVSSTISMVYYLWQKTFSHFEIGYGSAISWIILSTVLDAIQFALVGWQRDVRFNQAALRGGKRTLASYVRGELGTEGQRFLRGDATGIVALEFRNPERLVLRTRRGDRCL